MEIRKNIKASAEKICIKCNVILTQTNCQQYNLAHAKYICNDCLQTINQNKYNKHKNEIKKRQKNYELQNKLKVIYEYGGKCICCGEDKFEFLIVNHINNNNDAKERKITKQGTNSKLYRWLIKNNYPKDNYQLLCYNCNYAKDFFGYCPHKINN